MDLCSEIEVNVLFSRFSPDSLAVVVWSFLYLSKIGNITYLFIDRSKWKDLEVS